MSDLLVKPRLSTTATEPLIEVTPASAGWTYIGFEVHRIPAGGAFSWAADDRERCFVALGGGFEVKLGGDVFAKVPGRSSPFNGPPSGCFVPSETACELVAVGGEAEVACCAAPGAPGYSPFAILPDQVELERRGTGAMERLVRPIMMGEGEAHSLLVVEVRTPAGHWSSYPPHKHDEDRSPAETLLEETYYHRVAPDNGFGVQRVYSADGDLDETLTFRDGEVVLVPRGYHAVAMPPGYDGYYLNVMAGPVREWRMTDDPEHAWLRTW